MSGKTLDTKLCDFVRHLDDDEIQWLLEAPTLVPELMGLTDHLPTCRDCGDRVGRLLLETRRDEAASANRPAPLLLAASNAEPGDTGDSLVPFDHVTIEGNRLEFCEDAEGRVWLRGNLPAGVAHIVLGSDNYRLIWSSARAEPEIHGIGSIEVEEFIKRHESDPQNNWLRFA